jgi:hypothetical protein
VPKLEESILKELIMENENEYKQIPNARFGYMCSKEGVVLGLRGRPLKIRIGNSGYLEVQAKGLPTPLIHRLVAYTFIGVQENLVIDHINGDKKDNRLENIRYVSQRQNMFNTDIISYFKVVDIKNEKTYISNSMSEFCGVVPSIHISYKKINEGYNTQTYQIKRLSKEEFLSETESEEAPLVPVVITKEYKDDLYCGEKSYNKIYNCVFEAILPSQESLFFLAKATAAKYLNADASGISKALNGKLGSVKKIHFKYRPDIEKDDSRVIR